MTDAIQAYVKATGVPHRVTSVMGGQHSANSRHYRGLAVDLAGPVPSRNSPELLAIFKAFEPVEHMLYELIYSGARYSIKAGKRVPRYAVSGHWDHVHVSVDPNVIVPLPERAASLPPPTVTDFPQGQDMLRRIDVTIATDSNGNGWATVDAPADTVVSIVAQGPYPPDNNYWNLPVFGRQSRDGKTVVTVTEAMAAAAVPVSVWVVG